MLLCEDDHLPCDVKHQINIMSQDKQRQGTTLVIIRDSQGKTVKGLL